MQYDYNYLCDGLGHLTGLETRIYQNGELTAHYAHYNFAPDIAGLIYHEIENVTSNAFYIETDDMLLFGIIKCPKDNVTLIIGPTAQIRPNKLSAIAILNMLGEPYGRLHELQEYLSSMVPYPFENFLEILCFVNYALNDEKLSVSNLIKKSERFNYVETQTQYEADLEHIGEPGNTYQAEKLMLSYVTTGNIEGIQAFINSPPTGRVGSLAHNELRQRINTFICAAAIISRAAIAGGMPSEVAFALSDRYIQKAELLTHGGDITSLNMEMLIDYTTRVESLKCGSNDSPLAKNVMRYVLRNISKKISITDIADHLQMNRSYLCEKFKAETGNTINDFITATRIEESKRMLTVTDLSIAHISHYLSFSSQSYFQTVFKKLEGCTPKEFRAKQ